MTELSPNSRRKNDPDLTKWQVSPDDWTTRMVVPGVFERVASSGSPPGERRLASRRITSRLRAFYEDRADECPPYDVWTEIGHPTRRSRCDLLVFTARFRMLVGHEIKVSRSDWENERAQPEKSAAWIDECHEFWAVAPSVKIIPPDTLPAGWGLMVEDLNSDHGFIVIVPAVRKGRDHQPSWAVASKLISRSAHAPEPATPIWPRGLRGRLAQWLVKPRF